MRSFIFLISVLCTGPCLYAVTGQTGSHEAAEPMQWAYDNASSRAESSLRIRRIQSMINRQVELSEEKIFEAMTVETDR